MEALASSETLEQRAVPLCGKTTVDASSYKTISRRAWKTSPVETSELPRYTDRKKRKDNVTLRRTAEARREKRDEFQTDTSEENNAGDTRRGDLLDALRGKLCS